jgi:hypothetical protein
VLHTLLNTNHLLPLVLSVGWHLPSRLQCTGNERMCSSMYDTDGWPIGRICLTHIAKPVHQEGEWHHSFDVNALTMDDLREAAAVLKATSTARPPPASPGPGSAMADRQTDKRAPSRRSRPPPPRPPRIMKKHEPCTDTSQMGAEAFLEHLQALPWYSGQVWARHTQTDRLVLWSRWPVITPDRMRLSKSQSCGISIPPPPRGGGGRSLQETNLIPTAGGPLAAGPPHGLCCL